eukprot:TRINITY_DN25119_c0_g1_i1.p1 TRINITY_DN25119_c0_g1~~TRINITY_DN25119_c0_g1_i1.p1  ORF type:complete len:143 (+),score=22.33 TRINITY_DN25119_c0_g1_i1:60-431(+)
MCIRDSINEGLPNLAKVLTKVTSMAQLILDLNSTSLNDVGCMEVAQILRYSPTIVCFCLAMFSSNITDVGISFIASEMGFLKLEAIILNFCNTRITDEGVLRVSKSLRSSNLRLTFIMITFTE